MKRTFVCLIAAAMLLAIGTHNTPAALVAHWDLNDSVGTTATDISGNGNHGTIASPNWITGLEGTALRFNGTSQWITVPNSAQIIAANDSFSVFGWVKVNQHKNYNSMFGKGTILNGNYDNNVDWSIVSNDLGEVWALVTNNDGSSSVRTVFRDGIAEGIWYHIGMTWNGSMVMLYVNGERVNQAAGTLAGGLATERNFVIAYSANLQRPLRGEADDVRLYNHALSPTEVQALYEPHWEAATLVAHYDCNNGQGSVLTDRSLYGNHGTIVDGTWDIGIQGGGLAFDGVDDHVLVPHSLSLALTSEVTITSWALLPDSTDARFALFKRQGGGYAAWFSPDSAAGAVFGNFTHYIARLTPPGSWHHFVWTYDQTSSDLYIDGDSVGSVPYVGPIYPGTGPVAIGAGIDGAGNVAEHWLGVYDEVQIYYRALDSAQVDALYTSVAPPRLISAVASDNVIEHPGIDSDDYVLLTFDRRFGIVPVISGATVNSLLALSGGHTWLDGLGEIGGVEWSTDSARVAIYLLTTAGAPTVAVGDTVSFVSNGSRVPVTGSFGSSAVVPRGPRGAAFGTSSGQARAYDCTGRRLVGKRRAVCAGVYLLKTDLGVAVRALYTGRQR